MLIFPARNSTRAFDCVAPPRPPPNNAVPPTTIFGFRCNEVWKTRFFEGMIFAKQIGNKNDIGIEKNEELFYDDVKAQG